VRWCSFTTTTTAGGPARLGAVDGDRVLDVGAVTGAPLDLVDLVEAEPAEQQRVTELAQRAASGWLDLADVRLLAPLRAPNSLRDFLAFRDHVERGAARRGSAVPEAWDRIPVYYKGNRRTIAGPGEVVRWPSYTEKMDFECEVAAVVGRRSRDLTPEQAESCVFGWTVMDDWSARDVQRDEMSCWLGPAKAKDFCTSLGPVVVTPDEWSPEDDHRMDVLVDGEVWSTGSTAGRRWSFGEMLAWVSRDEDLWPTDVVGSGTFGGGCGLDLDRWLPDSCEVELRVDGLGSLVNRVERYSTSPSPRAHEVV
jgi:2-keto-4-pentenoate hydratase/2-oxohepta-3-ene-1,7-dioic acid hydratase in catechol pathway